MADTGKGKAIQIRVSFSDDAGNEDSLTSAATNAVAVPLTASLENTTDTHDGQNVFTFELRFSEEFSLSYKTLRDHALTVSGGAVENAGRIMKGSNLRWWVTVRPDANGPGLLHPAGNYRLRIPGSHLHERRQEAVQRVGADHRRSGPVEGNGTSEHIRADG